MYCPSHVLQHLSKRKDVGTRVALGIRLQLFGCHVAPCACRNLEHTECLAVRKSEVYQLHVASAMGEHYVRRLDVAVYNTLGVHILHSIEQLAGYLYNHVFGEFATCYSRLKRLAVDIFHYDALAKVAHLLHAYGAADVGMVELQAYLKLLHQRLTIHGRVSEVGLKAFQNVALAVSHSCEQTCMARL